MDRKYRLNMQVGNMLQHVTFTDNASAMAALTEIFQAKAHGLKVVSLPNALVDPSAVSFAEVKIL